MTRDRLSPLVLAALIVCSTGNASQAQGSATIAGVVMLDDATSQPLRRVTVSLVSGDLNVPRSTVTDDAGQFVFANLRAGSYGVTASKTAYVGAFYGSKRPGRGPGVPIAVLDGQHVANVRLKMLHGSVITGTLRLPGGRIAEGMPVAALEIETIGGAKRLRLTGGRSTTDDHGEFRIYGLAPGDYIVEARPSGFITGAPAGANDAPQTSVGDVSWANALLANHASAPSTGASNIAPPARGRTANYGPVYFPGTPSAAVATILSLGKNEERRGLDFSMALVTTAKISGAVVGLDGRPIANAELTLTAQDDPLRLAALVTPRAPVKSGADGSFVIPAIPPGRYRISARSAAATTAETWAYEDVVVDGRDTAGLTLQLQPGMSVSGTLTFEASKQAAPSGDDLARVRIALAKVEGDNAAIDAIASGPPAATTSVASNGSFVIPNVAPGAYRLTISAPNIRVSPTAATATWSLRSLALGGMDISDHTIDVQPRQDVRGVAATMTDRPTELTGTLTDAAGAPALGFPIVVFAVDRRYWTPSSRRIAEAHPATDGSFRLVGLPAGSYYLCALVDLDPGDLEDAAFLSQLAPAAMTISLRDGVPTVQNLRLAK